MGNLKTHKDLDVWQEGIELVTKVYAVVQDFPKEEKFGLVDQIKRASVSIPSNIAEGAARNSKKEFIHYLHIALGSLSELETQLTIASKLNFLKNTDIFRDIEKEKSKTLGLLRYLKQEKSKK